LVIVGKGKYESRALLATLATKAAVIENIGSKRIRVSALQKIDG